MNWTKWYMVSGAALALCGYMPISSQADELSTSQDPQEEYATTYASWHNDLEGFVQGKITFAQTHVTNATRKIFDPPLVPGREALVMFQPHPLARVSSASLRVRSAGRETVIAMTHPDHFPASRKYDQENVYSGKPIVGNYPKYESSFTATLPYDIVQSDMELTFVVNNDPQKSGTLPKSKMVFLNNESEGLVLMNIKGCLFRTQSLCRTTLDQYDMQKNPELAKIAAREMFSEMPVKQLVLGMGESYWPYVIARGPDGKPHRYSTTDRNYREWAAFGDLTLSAKLGMGNFWRAASDLGYKSPGKFVAISGQFLDVPDDTPSMPPGVAASCGGNSCNYPNYPAGFWHETGHGLGLSHVSPPRYEGWGWRSYDLSFLPNYHPAPQNYGLSTDHLGFNYFGNVVGRIPPPSWPEAVASAPLIDEFEELRRTNPVKTADWKHYLAPWTHQQMLIVQRRFGSLPAGLPYAGYDDDHRQPPGPPPTLGAKARSDDETQIDPGIVDAPEDHGILLELIPHGQQPILKGVPVHTLVVTMADRSHDAAGLSQIYPAILSNYGNVFAPNQTLSATDEPSPAGFRDARLRSAKTGKCLSVINSRAAFEQCHESVPRQRWTQSGEPLFRLMNGATLACINKDLQLAQCSDQRALTWNARKDLTHSDTVIRLQSNLDGRFITAGPDDSISMEGIRGDEQLFFQSDRYAPDNNYVLEVQFLNASVSRWPLYPGPIPADGLLTAVVNVASSSQPRTARLLRNGVVINTRQLQDSNLPPPVTVGGAVGYPTIIPKLLKSQATGKCLIRRSDVRVDQVPCDPRDKDQQWGTAPVLSSAGQRVVITGSSTAFCLQWPTRLKRCEINSPDFQWVQRQDLSPAGTMLFQNGRDGTFITAAADGHSVNLQGLTYGADQQFRMVALTDVALDKPDEPAEAVGDSTASEVHP